jgi:TetR/AcrR family transcriptional regulator, cholesterol catabolism regulator
MSNEVPAGRKEAIYAAAARLFREKGYPATTMRELAAAVGLEASSLYAHIASKADLLEQICFSAARAFLSGIERVERDCADPLTQIREIIALHVHIALEDPTSQTVFNDEWRHLPAERLSEFLALRREYEKRFRAIITKGQQAGMIQPLDPDTVMLTLLAGLRWVHSGRLRPGHKYPARLSAEISQLLIEGLRCA